MSLSARAINKVRCHWPGILHIIKSKFFLKVLYHTVYELHLNKHPCQLLRSICSSALDKKTHVTLAFSCSLLLAAPQAANSHSLCKNTAGGAQRRTRQSFSPLRPAPMMFLKNILIDAAIKQDKSKRCSSGTSVWRVFDFPGQVYLDITERLSWFMTCISARVHCRENICCNWLQRVTKEKSKIKWCASLLRGSESAQEEFCSFTTNHAGLGKLQNLFFIN